VINLIVTQNKTGQTTLTIPKSIVESLGIKKGDDMKLKITPEGLLYNFPEKIKF